MRNYGPLPWDRSGPGRSPKLSKILGSPRWTRGYGPWALPGELPFDPSCQRSIYIYIIYMFVYLLIYFYICKLGPILLSLGKGSLVKMLFFVVRPKNRIYPPN